MSTGELMCISITERTLDLLTKSINHFLNINQGRIEIVTNNVLYLGYQFHAVIIYKVFD